MKAVVFHDVGDIRLEDVTDPVLQEPTDAIIGITASAICGTDLHMVRGTMPGMKSGTILGHEAVGVVEQIGKNVRNLTLGDRVVCCSTIACGYCSYCRSGYYAQCNRANPNGAAAGTCFFGGPKTTGPIHGLQAEKARIPFAHVTLVRLPKEIDDSRAILLSDIFPTGYFGAHLAEIHQGDTVCVFGCGPVGQFAILSAELMGAGRVLAVDRVASRLDKARAQGAEVINFDQEDPVEVIRDLTGGIGVDRVIDAVGVDAQCPSAGPASKQDKQRFAQEMEQVAPVTRPHDGQWEPGGAPSQALSWAVEGLAKAGTLAIIGVYPENMRSFPLGKAMNKNLTIRMGNCNHRRYVPKLIELVQSRVIDPITVLTQSEPLVSAIEAYETFDRHEPGWMKVMLEPKEVFSHV